MQQPPPRQPRMRRHERPLVRPPRPRHLAATAVVLLLVGVGGGSGRGRVWTRIVADTSGRLPGHRQRTCGIHSFVPAMTALAAWETPFARRRRHGRRDDRSLLRTTFTRGSDPTAVTLITSTAEACNDPKNPHHRYVDHGDLVGPTSPPWVAPSRPRLTRQTLLHQARHHVVAASLLLGTSVGTTTGWPLVATAATAELATTTTPPAVSTARSTSSAAITDRIYLDIVGMPVPSSSSWSTTTSSHPNNAQARSAVSSSGLPAQRIVIGLFGQDAPRCVSQLVALLASPAGWPTPCQPRAIRTLQRDQLEANKVYQACQESVAASSANGVTLRSSTVWRIVPGYRIDVGAVTGQFLAREFPLWQEDVDHGAVPTAGPFLTHDQAGVVSVRRGHDGGFGFAIYPGSASEDQAVADGLLRAQLDAEQIVVGRVLQGLDVIQALNSQIPLVQSASLSLTGPGQDVMARRLSLYQKLRPAPSRSCRYGGQDLYCNEYKPLVKLTVTETGRVK